MESMRTKRCHRVIVMALAAFLFGYAMPSVAQEDCPLVGQLSNVIEGFRLAPVALSLTTDTNPLLVGLGSYIVNAQGGCNDCHTEPSYAPGGDPFLGEPEQINTVGYLKGGRAFGPVISRNLTPCGDGKPAGLTVDEFITVMRTGTDLKDAEFQPPNTPILQVMPWTIYGKMSDCDLQAVYEYLRTIPSAEGCTPVPSN
jgi:hypothetical protein